MAASPNRSHSHRTRHHRLTLVRPPLGPGDHWSIVIQAVRGRERHQEARQRTLRLKLLRPAATFTTALASPFKIVPVGFDPRNPVGTGPFKYRSFTPNRQWVCERFANYWNASEPSQPSGTAAPGSLGPKPYLDELVVNVINDDSARMEALVSGQVDAINQVQYAQISTIDADPRLKLMESRTGA